MSESYRVRMVERRSSRLPGGRVRHTRIDRLSEDIVLRAGDSIIVPALTYDDYFGHDPVAVYEVEVVRANSRQG